MRCYLAEAIGTFALVFCGTGAIVIDELTAGGIGHVGIAATFGLVVMAMIYTFGDVSGAHLNPAVTLGFFVARRFRGSEVVRYLVAQLLGAFLATWTLHFLFPGSSHLGATLPAGSAWQSFVLESILSFLLMLVILNVSHGSKEIGVLAGIAIGGTILLEAMFAGPISGASMNPARSLAPAVVSGSLSSLWVYLFAPLLGTVCGAFTWSAMKEKRGEV